MSGTKVRYTSRNARLVGRHPLWKHWKQLNSGIYIIGEGITRLYIKVQGTAEEKEIWAETPSPGDAHNDRLLEMAESEVYSLFAQAEYLPHRGIALQYHTPSKLMQVHRFARTYSVCDSNNDLPFMMQSNEVVHELEAQSPVKFEMDGLVSRILEHVEKVDLTLL